MQDAKIKNCKLHQQIRELIAKSEKCKLHARFFPLISFCKLRHKFGCKKFLISKYPPLVVIAISSSESFRRWFWKANGVFLIRQFLWQVETKRVESCIIRGWSATRVANFDQLSSVQLGSAQLSSEKFWSGPAQISSAQQNFSSVKLSSAQRKFFEFTTLTATKSQDARLNSRKLFGNLFNILNVDKSKK